MAASKKREDELQRALKAANDKNRDLEAKLQLAEKTIETQKKEILLLQRNATRQDKGAPQTRASVNLPQNPRTGYGEEQSNNSKTDDLQQKNGELVECVKKQAKYIDVLKRQKMLLEAGLLLSFSEKELSQLIDTNQW
ncbi:hypothetical protein ADEAN_000807200 [Angomonas deanei]|uniref:Uncharacterized protein n=1 Tax=Angomonas deanei TaxID=59799 RepID=A0A7G2CL16_9TRYP|nr:hypothetical protein ADEAN_000807200 [Angomonas deanei]